MQEAKNERLWFKTNLKLCGLWFKLKEYGRAQKILRELHKCGMPHSIRKQWALVFLQACSFPIQELDVCMLM